MLGNCSRSDFNLNLEKIGKNIYTYIGAVLEVPPAIQDSQFGPLVVKFGWIAFDWLC